MELTPAQKQALPPSNYWFVLGRQTQLSAAELNAVFKLNNKLNKIEDIVKINLNTNPQEYINRLGGTIKIGQEIGGGLKQNELEQKIIEQLDNIQGKINFGISAYANSLDIGQIKKIALRIKKQLKASRRSVRYVANQEPTLSSATVKNNNLTTKGVEFLIIRIKDKFDLAKTLTVQPFEKFSERDFGRPNRDDFSGMLPPKLAIMMINLAQAEKNKTILDPFCGSGTILTEASLLNYANLIGTDFSPKAIADSQTNIDWIKKKYNLKNNCQLIQAQIEDLPKIIKQKISAIITEPYLGKPLKGSETREQLEKQAGELKKIYLQAFSSFKNILEKNGVVIFLIPRFIFRRDWILVDCINEIKQMGFSSIPMYNSDCILYHRPNQKLAREIWKFIKK